MDNFMKIGFQSSAYNNLTLLEELKFAWQNKADFFDVFFDGFMPDDVSPEEYDFINQLKCEGFDFTVHLPIEIHKCTEEQLNELSIFVEKIKPVTATVHFDKLNWAFLEKLLSLFGKNTKLCIENTIPDNNPFLNCDYFSFMAETCKKYEVFSTFDTGHCNVNLTAQNNSSSGSIEVFAAGLLQNGVQIATVHNHDNFGDKDSHLAVGDGIIDFSNFYKTLKTANQQPMLVIEHWNNNTKSLENLKKLQ